MEMVTNKSRINPNFMAGTQEAKTVATKKKSGGVTAALKVRTGSGSTTGASTAKVSRK